MLRLEVLGTPGLTRDGHETVQSVLARPKQFALLAYLATRPAARHRRDSLLALLWPKLDGRRARKALRQSLYGLRRSLGPQAIRSVGNELIGVAPEHVWCDAAEFTDLVSKGSDAGALRLYRGSFLGGFYVSGSAPFEHWLDGEQRRFQRMAVEAAWRLSEAAESDAPMQARKWAERAMDLSPHDENGFRRYLDLLARQGDLSTALRAYEEFARRLARELDTRPAPETEVLVERLRREPTIRRTPPVVERHPVSSVAQPAESEVDIRLTPVRDVRPDRSRKPWTGKATRTTVLLAAISGLALLAARQDDPLGRSPPRSILVLPLTNLSEDPRQEYFSDGLTEALITELGQVKSLTVFSRATSMRFKGQDAPLSAIDRSVGAEKVLEGSAQRVDGRVRVSLRLIDVPTERVLWADDYEEDLRNVLDLQKRIARTVAHEVGVRTSLQESQLLSRGQSVQPAAYEEYLRGRYWFAKWTSDGFLEATRSFQRAVYIDSTFAAAYAGLAYALLHVCYFGLADAPPHSQCNRRVEAAARRALELDTQLADAYLTLGFVRWWGYPRDRRESEQALLHALRLNPGQAEIHSRYAFLMSTLGRHDEAIAAFRRAFQLDPLAPDRAGFVAWELGVAGRFEEAERAARKAIALEPEFANSHAWLGMTILAPQGRYEEAVVSLRRALELAGPHSMFRGMLGYVLGAAGRTAEAEAMLDELLHGPGADRVPPYYVALTYMGLGRDETALSWLEKANREGWGHVIYLNVYHAWRPLREHPRFEKLLEDIGLPPGHPSESLGTEDATAPV